MINQPNIIYVLTDDQRAELLGCMGHPVLKTPHLDQLAQNGVLFKNAYCTSPVCTPSRACHYLGQWERKHGVNFNSNSSVSVEAWEYSLPMLLKKKGYYIGWVGKNHVPVGDQGYESGYMEQHFNFWYGNHDHTGFYPKERFPEVYGHAQHHTQAEVFGEGIAHFLDPSVSNRPSDQPFGLFVTFNMPHSSSTWATMEMRPEDDELYKSTYRENMKHFPLPKTYLSYMDAFNRPRLPKSVYNGRYLTSYDYVRTPNAMREQMVRVFQTVTGIDRVIGKMMKQLEELGIADNTIIVFSTDHGIHWGEHGLGGKCFLYEEDLHIPLIVYDPRLPEGRRGQVRKEFALVPDLAPTVLDMAGCEIPETMQGRSLLPLITGESVAWREEFFAEQLMDIQNYAKSECIRTTEWKYIRYFPRTEDPAQEGMAYRSTLDDYHAFLSATADPELCPVYEELFHLTEDPLEKTNVADQPQYQGVLDDMRRRLLHHVRSLLA